MVLIGSAEKGVTKRSCSGEYRDNDGEGEESRVLREKTISEGK